MIRLLPPLAWAFAIVGLAILLHQNEIDRASGETLLLLVPVLAALSLGPRSADCGQTLGRAA